MGKKYLDIKDNSLESSVYNVLHGIQEKVNEGSKEEYQKFFNAAMKKFGIDSPADLKSDEEKKKFFDYVDKNYKGEKDEEVQKLHQQLFPETKVKEGLEDSPNSANSQHLCAKNVVHENWGNGTPISGQHAEPDANGDIAWYDVMFEHGIEKGVSINELKVTKAESHHHSEKKKKKMDEEVDLDEGTWKVPETKIDQMALRKTLRKPIPLGKEGDNAADAISPYIGDDSLLDDLFTAGKKNPKADARPIIKKAMKRLGIKEEVDLDEGKMNQMHQMMKDGKTAAQIAKALKLDLKTVKALMDSYNKMVPESFEIGTEKYLKHTVETTPGQKEWTETVTKKASSMRETLAKVWEADVGKSPFQKNAKEDLTKGVKGGTTMTGKKVAAVDTKPTIKEKKK